MVWRTAIASLATVLLAGCAAVPAPASSTVTSSPSVATATSTPTASTSSTASGSGSFTYSWKLQGSEDYDYPLNAGHESGTYSSSQDISGQLKLQPQDLSDPTQLVYAVLGTYQLGLAAKSNWTFTIHESADLYGQGTMDITSAGNAMAHEPPLAGESRYQQEIANGETASDIAQEMGTLTVGFDDAGNVVYELGLQPNATLTPTYSYHSVSSGKFATLSGTCTRVFDNTSGTLTQTGDCGAVQAQLGTVTANVGVPPDLLSKGTIDPQTGILTINVNTSTSSCGLSNTIVPLDGEDSHGGTTNTDPLYIGEVPQVCTETTMFTLQLSVPPFGTPRPSL